MYNNFVGLTIILFFKCNYSEVELIDCSFTLKKVQHLENVRKFEFGDGGSIFVYLCFENFTFIETRKKNKRLNGIKHVMFIR